MPSVASSKASPVAAEATRASVAPTRILPVKKRLPGNQALLRAQRLRPLSIPLQTKLRVGSVDDPLEREADRVAEHVMRMPEPASLAYRAGSETLQRQCESGAQEDEQQTLRRKCQSCSEEDTKKNSLSNTKKENEETHEKLALKESGRAATLDGSAAPAIVHDVLNSPGQPLDAATRAFFEPRFGADFSSVRVHTDARASESARSVNALAYAVGNHIAFGANQFAPHNPLGTHLLAHELTHIVQQASGLHPRVQRTAVECAEEIANPPDLTLIAGGGTAIHQMIRDDFSSHGGIDVFIPGASAAPLRTEGICGKPSSAIPPQTIGGQAGGGMPDLAMKTPAGILLVAEIKPAVIPCLIDGENQVLGYIDQGNATDPAQVAWRASMGVSVVSPMLEKHYQPPSFYVGIAQIETTWCSPGLLAYTIYRPGSKAPVPLPIPAKQPTTEEQRKTLRQRLPSVPEWVWVVAGAAVAAAVIACFATGACELGAVLAGVGEGIAWLIMNALRLAGVAVLAQANPATPPKAGQGPPETALA